MGSSVEYHLAKADYQCRRALSKLTREGSPRALIEKLGHAIATLREVRTGGVAPPRYTRIVWTTWTPTSEPADRLEVSDDGAVWRVATDAEKRAYGYLGKGEFVND